MQGYLLIDSTREELRRIDGTLFRDVSSAGESSDTSTKADTSAYSRQTSATEAGSSPR